MADPVDLFKEALVNNTDGLTGGSRGDFMEALGEAVYARMEAGKVDDIIAAHLVLQDVLEVNVDNLDDSADDEIEAATDDFNESVGKTLGL
jgi:hypothetical protein